jgi:excisionase family DNA binding protein
MTTEYGDYPEVMTVRQFATRRGISEETVRRLISTGELVAARSGLGDKRGPWKIRRAAAIAYVQKRERQV